MAYLYVRSYPFREALANLGADANELCVREMLEAEIDVENLSLLFRLSGIGGRHAALLVDGGSLPSRLLAEVAAARDVEAMVRLLQETPYGNLLQGLLEKYRQSGNASVLERALEEHLVLKGIRMFHRDPLSIAIPIGYVWAKSNEVANLRLIAQGRALGWPPEAIREEMIWWVRE
jgi:V/A-type H+-transporting ATPase subunit C